MFEERNRVIAFAKEMADSQPVARRVLLYRDMAEMCGNPQEAADLKTRAVELEVADLRCREFAFAFNKGKAGTNGGAAK